MKRSAAYPGSMGFTMLEVMVVVAFVAILSLLATGSYRTAMAKGDRSTAISDIGEIVQALERYYTFNRRYSNDFSDLSMAASSAATITDSKNLYNYYIGIGRDTGANQVPQGTKSGTSYVVFAKPTSGNRDDWTLAQNDLGQQYRYESDSTTRITGWP